MHKILILGSSGLLGYHIYKKLSTYSKIQLFHTGLKKRYANLLNKKNLKKLLITKNPDIIINCIGFTNIERCEKFKSVSKKINFELLKNIFLIKKKNKLKFNLIHISTDQLYNKKNNKKNNENSKIFILNTYCKHKRMAEHICLKNKALVFRTNFFGKSFQKTKSFSDWVFQSFKTKKKTYLFNDVKFNPLRIDTITKLFLSLIKQKKYKIHGIYNLGTRDGIFKNEFALFFAKKTFVLNSNYAYINVNKLLKVKRSTNMFMNIKKFENKFKIKLPYIKKEILEETEKYI
tara:strand:+ start:165 stop:1034 length:870 start_codon:yes stop_codon:yes gene_type:complete